MFTVIVSHTVVYIQIDVNVLIVIEPRFMPSYRLYILSILESSIERMRQCTAIDFRQSLLDVLQGFYNMSS